MKTGVSLVAAAVIPAALGFAACGGKVGAEESVVGAGGSSGSHHDASVGGSGGSSGVGGSGGSTAFDGCPGLGCAPNCGDAGIVVDENGCSTCSCNPGPDSSDCGNTSIDPKNCGICGHDCLDGTCQSGTCMPVTLANQGGVAIAVDADAVYWADLGNSKVMKVPLSGGASVILASNQAQPRGIAVNTSAVCWTNSGSDTVMRIGLSGGTPVTVASTQKYPFGIAMDADAVY